MRPGWRRALKVTLLGLLALVLVAAGALAWLALGSLPKLSGEMRLAGLGASVRVVRDRWAIPHVAAGSEADAYAALGFLHAQDRLWQMEVNRLIGQGRLAELVGAPGLQIDRTLRTMGLARAAKASLASLSPEARGLLDAYVRGVNAFLTERSGPLPPEFLILRHRPKPWAPEDCLLQLKLLALDLAGNWRQELQRTRLAQRLTPEQLADLWPEAGPDDPTTLATVKAVLGDLDQRGWAIDEPPSGLGSNEWVEAGNLTTTGKPFLANDPHLGLTMPGIWYLAHLEAPGLAVIGASVPGMPFVVLGRNRDLAWGFTNTGSDVQDLFIETPDPADPGRYLAPGGPLPFVTREEVVAVRGEADQRLRVRETRHGPVLSDVLGDGGGPPLALAWTGLAGDDSTLETGFAIPRAHDWDGFVAAFRSYANPTQNVAYADRSGRIGLLNPGRVPIRKAGDGRLPAPGADGSHDWTGFIPFEALPRELKQAGFFANANNRLVGPDYPYFLASDWEVPFRVRRIEAGLTAGRPMDLDANRALQQDVRSGLAEALLPVLLATQPPDEEAHRTLDALRGWDLRMAAEAWQPLLFAAWYRQLGPLVWADELGDAARGVRMDALVRMLKERPVWCDDVRTPEVEDCAERSRRALELALVGLRQAYGADWQAWRWGRAHPAVLAHRPFDEVPTLRRLFSTEVPVGGDGSTVDVAGFMAGSPEEPFANGHGPSYRGLYDLAAPDASRFVIASGQSGHPLSGHYRDLTTLWARGEDVPMSMDPADYGANALGELVLQP